MRHKDDATPHRITPDGAAGVDVEANAGGEHSRSDSIIAAPDAFLARFGTRAGFIASRYFYGAIRNRGAITPKQVVAGVRAIGQEEWRRAERWGNQHQQDQLRELAEALNADRGGALAFAAEALRREAMSPEERAALKAQLARQAAMRGKPSTDAQRLFLARRGIEPPADRAEASALIDRLRGGEQE